MTGEPLIDDLHLHRPSEVLNHEMTMTPALGNEQMVPLTTDQNKEENNTSSGTTDVGETTKT